MAASNVDQGDISNGSARPAISTSSHGGFCKGLKKGRKGPFVIGVAGGTASGKSTVCERIIEEIKVDPATNSRSIHCLSTDRFYKDLAAEESELAKKGNFNFDHPEAFDVGRIRQTLRDIRDQKVVKVPQYDYRLNASIADDCESIGPTDVIIVEGILAFYWPELRDQYDMMLFVDADADTRLARRVKRDINDRGRSLDTIINQYINTVKPAFEEFCLPTKKFADVIIPRGADNTVAIDLIVQSIKDVLANDDNSTEQPVKTVGQAPPTLIKRNSDSKTARLH